MAGLTTHITFSKQLAVPDVAEDLVWVGDGGNNVVTFLNQISLVTDKAVFIYIDGLNDADRLDLRAGESWTETGISFRRLRFVNQVALEQPTVRGVAWG